MKKIHLLINILILTFITINCSKQECYEYSCDECSTPEYGTCTKCRSDFKLIDGTCPCSFSSCALCTTGLAGLNICEQCKEGYTNTDGNCVCSISNCEQCGEDGCKKCISGYYYNETLKQCLKDNTENKIECYDPQCDGCLSEEQGACEYCKEGYYLKKGECLALKIPTNGKCPDNYYPSGNYCYEICDGVNCNRLAMISPNFILLCPENQCLVCVNYNLLIFSECDNSDVCGELEGCLNCLTKDECLICQQGYYPLGGKCKKCSEGCSICSSKTNCQVCLSGYELTSDKMCNLTYNFDYNTDDYQNKKIDLIKKYYPEEIPKPETTIPIIETTISTISLDIKTSENKIDTKSIIETDYKIDIKTDNKIEETQNVKVEETTNIKKEETINIKNDLTTDNKINIPTDFKILETKGIKIIETTNIKILETTNMNIIETTNVNIIETTNIKITETTNTPKIETTETKVDLIIDIKESDKTQIINAKLTLTSDKNFIKYYGGLGKYVIQYGKDITSVQEDECNSICSNINCLNCEIREGTEICISCSDENKINSDKCNSICSVDKCSSYSLQENDLVCNNCLNGYYLDGDICVIKCQDDNCITCSEDGKVCTVCNTFTKLYQGRCAKNKDFCSNYLHCSYCFPEEECIQCDDGFEVNNKKCVKKKSNLLFIVVLIFILLIIVGVIIYFVCSKKSITGNINNNPYSNEQQSDIGSNYPQIHNNVDDLCLPNSIRTILSRDELAEEYENQKRKTSKPRMPCMFCKKKPGNFKCDCGCIVCKEHSELKELGNQGEKYKVCLNCGKMVNNITAIKYFCNICMQDKPSVVHFKCGCSMEVCKNCYIRCKMSNDKCPGCRAII